MYAGVCAFKDGVQELFKCDTVDATCEERRLVRWRRFRQRMLQSCPWSHLAVLPRDLGQPIRWRAGYENENFDNILLEAMMAMRASWERLSGHDGDGEPQEDL